MRVLFDNSTPRGVAAALAGHVVTEARERGWDRLRKGELLDAAEQAGFDVLLTPDQNMRHQQNLTGRKIALVVLGKDRWTLVKPYLERIAATVNAVTPGSYAEVDIPYPPRRRPGKPVPSHRILAHGGMSQATPATSVAPAAIESTLAYGHAPTVGVDLRLRASNTDLCADEHESVSDGRRAIYDR